MKKKDLFTDDDMHQSEWALYDLNTTYPTLNEDNEEIADVYLGDELFKTREFVNKNFMQIKETTWHHKHENERKRVAAKEAEWLALR